MMLGQRVLCPPIVVAPGIYDGLTAFLAEQSGAEAVYLSGAPIAYARFGRPDIGLVSMAEVADTISAIRDRVEIPMLVDADTGFGNALNVQRTVRTFERAGASALQIEDQTMPKRCGHLAGKAVIPTREMIGKIHAALDARRSTETMIVARTDAIAVEGFDRALARAFAYAEAGADMVFMDALQTEDQMRTATSSMVGLAPIMANMVEGGRSPIRTATELQSLGFSLAIFPGGIVRALAATARDYYSSLIEKGSTEPFADRMLTFDELNLLIGTPEMLALGKRYENSST